MVEPTKRNAALLMCFLALLVPQGELAAQLTSRLQAGAVMSAAPGLVPDNALSLTPDVLYESRLFKLAAHGSAWIDGNSWQFADGDATATVSTPVRHHLAAQLVADASRAYYDQINQNDQVEAAARVHLVFSQNGGMWLENGVARPWRVAVVSSVDVAGAGAWTQVGGATITGTYTNFSFTRIGSASDSGGALQSCTDEANNSHCMRQSHFSDVQGTIHWVKAAVELNAQTGYRFGNASDVTPDSRRVV